MMRITTLCIISLITSICQATTGDRLYVHGKTVNMRSGPATHQKVVIKLHKGHELIEIDREDQWVEVAATRTGGKTGWVHENLVSKEFKGGKTTTPPSSKFDKFNSAFAKLNNNIKNKTGILFFTHAENLNDGIIQITATDTWLNAPLKNRQQSLKTIFNIWNAAEGTELPIAVYIVDKKGNKRMSMNR